jgi:hypothetical protein
MQQRFSFTSIHICPLNPAGYAVEVHEGGLSGGVAATMRTLSARNASLAAPPRLRFTPPGAPQ